MKVSIIIPVFNRCDYTVKCLETLYKNTFTPGSFPSQREIEVIVVDNGSSDETPSFLKEAAIRYPYLKVLTNTRNEGFARATNQGAQIAQGKYLVFLNNDTEPQPGWLKPLVDMVDRESRIGVVSGKLLFPWGTLQHAGMVIVRDQRLDNFPSPVHIYYQQPGDLAEAGIVRRYQVLTAACLLVRRALFEKAGPLDEHYFNGYEDVDLCLAIGKLGYQLVYQPASRVIHHEFGSGWTRFVKGSQNLQRFLEKWGKTLVPDFIRTGSGPYRLNPYSPTAALNPGLSGKWLPLNHLPPGYVSAEYFLLGEKYHAAGHPNWKYYYRKSLRILLAREKITGQETYRIASIYKRLGNYSAAEQRFQVVIDTHHDQDLAAGAYFHLGELKVQQGNSSYAAHLFREVLKRNPQHQKAQDYLNEI
jgi:GT2 family glycosyltransferase